MSSFTYTSDEIWDAISVMNPKQPIEKGKEHIFAMIIPCILALEYCRDKFEIPDAINIRRNIAKRLLARAYYDLACQGHFNYKDIEQ